MLPVARRALPQRAPDAAALIPSAERCQWGPAQGASSAAAHLPCSRQPWELVAGPALGRKQVAASVRRQGKFHRGDDAHMCCMGAHVSAVADGRHGPRLQRHIELPAQRVQARAEAGRGRQQLDGGVDEAG